MIIKDPAERKQRSEAKRRAVLRFLRSEVWSNGVVLQAVMGINTRQQTHRVLTKLEADGFIRRHLMDIEGSRGITLWGITTHGQAFAWDEDEDIGDMPIFEPSRVALTTLPHHLDAQLARVQAEAQGWSNWIICDRGTAFKDIPSDHRPDAIVTRPDGVTVAVEVERTIKTRKRYQQILSSHLKAMSGKHWAKVYYVCPGEIASRLERVIRSISHINVNGTQVALEEKYLARFEFVSLEDWPKAGETEA